MRSNYMSRSRVSDVLLFLSDWTDCSLSVSEFAQRETALSPPPNTITAHIMRRHSSKSKSHEIVLGAKMFDRAMSAAVTYSHYGL